MQTTFPKVSAVILSVCSILFMGMGVAARFGRPDPLAEMAAGSLDDYEFTPEVTSEAYNVTGPDGTAKKSETPYAAVAYAYDDKARKLKTDISDWSQQTQQMISELTLVNAAQDSDSTALKNREQALMQQVSNLEKLRGDLSTRYQELSVQTMDVRVETSQRREDVTRLQSELTELRTDTFRLREIQRVLMDRLVRLQIENQNLEERLEQITSP